MLQVSQARGFNSRIGASTRINILAEYSPEPLPTSDQTRIKVLSVLREHSLRGMVLREELRTRFGMSDETRNNCLSILGRLRHIEREQVGPGRSSEYSITSSGIKWLDEAISTGQSFLGKVLSKRVPIAIGYGNAEVTLRTDSIKSQIAEIADLSILLHRPELGEIVEELIRFRRGRDSQKKKQHDNRLLFELGIRVETEIDEDIGQAYSIMKAIRTTAENWVSEHEQMFYKLYDLYKLRKTEDELYMSTFDRFCSFDYFYLRPEAIVEACLIKAEQTKQSPNSPRFLNGQAFRIAAATTAIPELSYFAANKWPLLGETVKDSVRRLVNRQLDVVETDSEWPNEPPLYRYRWGSRDFRWMNYEGCRHCLLPSYKPTFRILENTVVANYSNSMRTASVVKLFQNKKVVNWLQINSENGWSWFREAHPWRIIQSAGMLSDIKCPHNADLDFESQPNSVFLREEIRGHPLSLYGQNLSADQFRDSLIHSLSMSSYEFLFDLAHFSNDDYQWFLFWRQMRLELMGRSTLSFYDPIDSSILTLPNSNMPGVRLLIDFLDKMYRKWVIEVKPKGQDSYKMRKLFQKAFDILLHFEMTMPEDDALQNTIQELELSAAESDHPSNEADWTYWRVLAERLAERNVWLRPADLDSHLLDAPPRLVRELAYTGPACFELGVGYLSNKIREIKYIGETGNLNRRLNTLADDRSNLGEVIHDYLKRNYTLLWRAILLRSRSEARAMQRLMLKKYDYEWNIHPHVRSHN